MPFVADIHQVILISSDDSDDSDDGESEEIASLGDDIENTQCEDEDEDEEDGLVIVDSESASDSSSDSRVIDSVDEITEDELEMEETGSGFIVNSPDLITVSDSETSSEEEAFIQANRSHNSIGTISITQFRHLLRTKENEHDIALLYPPPVTASDHKGTTDHNEEQIESVIRSLPMRSGYREIRLDNFCAYNTFNHPRYPGQYESLHTIASEQAKRDYLLDGTINIDIDGRGIRITSAVILKVAIGVLDPESHSCNDIWVQTKPSSRFSCWFRLGRPVRGYESYWHDFCWIAYFAKYFIDFMCSKLKERCLVRLDDFRARFIEYLTSQHGGHPEFEQWRLEYGGCLDMRRHLTQFGPFLYDQCHSADLPKIEQYPVWEEIGCFRPFSTSSDKKTVVTHNAASTFLPSFPQWGAGGFDLLSEHTYNQDVEEIRQQRRHQLHLANKFILPQQDHFREYEGVRTSKVEWTLTAAASQDRSIVCQPNQLLNKLVVVRRERNNKRFHDFAWVTEVCRNKRNVRVAWLMLPNDTICARPNPGIDRKRQHAYYPIGNEMFFSDDCNCFAVEIIDIVGSYDIAVLDEYKGGPCEFLATIQYHRNDQCFMRITKQQLHFTCKIPCVEKNGHREESNRLITPLKNHPILHNSSMQNLSLFSGCGLFDRALEASGHLHTTLSIDSNSYAIRAAQATSQPFHLGEAEFVNDSVNTELLRIMSGERKHPYPDSLSAGCPCPGFSILNRRRNHSSKSQRDCTLLLSTMSWIEVTLPGFVVIENVPSMDSGSPSPCSQAIAFLVTLGYQVRKFVLQAADFGGCTIRMRLFIVAAAPAYQLPDRPQETHGSQDDFETELKPQITAYMAISDLPKAHNDSLVSIKEPYHIPIARLASNLINEGPNLRDVLHRIPTSPPGHGVANSQHFLTTDQRKWLSKLHSQKTKKESRTMRRIFRDGLFRTVVTEANYMCANAGQIVHYDQDRMLTLEEVARAQGVPGDFVLVGSLAQKLRQVGNAVPWCLREAIGREIVAAFLRSPCVEKEKKRRRSVVVIVSSDVEEDTGVKPAKQVKMTAGAGEDEELK